MGILHERIVREFFACLDRGDLESLRQFLHPHATWEVRYAPSAPPVFTDGTEAILADFLTRGRRQFASGITRTEVQRIVSTDDVVVAETTLYADLVNGRKYCNNYAWIVTFEDGVISGIRDYTDTAYAASVFGA